MAIVIIISVNKIVNHHNKCSGCQSLVQPSTHLDVASPVSSYIFARKKGTRLQAKSVKVLTLTDVQGEGGGGGGVAPSIRWIENVFTWFLILDEIQDGDNVWWRHRPPAAPPPIKYTSSCREDERLSTEGKIVSKYCNMSKTQGGGGWSINPHSLVPPWGVWLCVYVWGLTE